MPCFIRSSGMPRILVLGLILGFAPAAEDPAILVERLADPDQRLAALTTLWGQESQTALYAQPLPGPLSVQPSAP